MDPMSLDDLLAQLGLSAPLVAPPPAPPQPAPYDTSVVPGTAFGAPYPAPGEVATPGDYGGHDMTPIGVKQNGVVPADTGYGYTPQPRGALPTQLGDTGINPDLFNTYRNLYSPAAPEEDVLTRLLGDTTQGMPGFRQEPPPSRALNLPGARTPSPQYGAQGGVRSGGVGMMTDSERRLRERGPEFNRVADRFHELNAMRSRRGF